MRCGWRTSRLGRRPVPRTRYRRWRSPPPRAIPRSTRSIQDPLRAARIGTAVILFVFGCAVGTWAARVPLIKQQLGLDAGQLSAALLGAPVGLVLAVQLVPRAVARWTSARVTRLAALGSCGALVLPAVAWNLGSLAVALFLLGFAQGTLDAAVNTQAVAVERGYRRPVMSGLHAMYSVGVLAGGGLGAVAAGVGVDPLPHFAVIGGLLACACWLASRALLGPEADAAADADGARAEHVRSAATRALVVLGVIALCSYFAEGAVDSWSAVSLHEIQRAGLGLAPLGAAACGAGMAIGRLGGDLVIGRFGRRATLSCAGLIAAGGIACAVFAAQPGIAIAGFAVFGLGAATIVPITFTLAGNAAGVSPAAAISRVATFAYAGQLTSPVVIGVVAQASTLSAGMAVPGLLMLVVALLGGRAPTRNLNA